MDSLVSSKEKLSDFQLVDRGPSELDFSKGISNLSDREAMGFPDHYVKSSLEQSDRLFVELTHLNKSQLVEILENEQIEFSRRFSVGQLLALLGDPRITTESPDMITIPSWSGFLGLNIEDLDRVTAEFSAYGIQREWIEKETPAYKAEIARFKIGKYPVTNSEYLQFLNETKHTEIPTSWIFRNFPLHAANHPVYSLSADSCITYTEWLSHKTGRKFRLPTEKEWEFAAGGTEQLEYPWGNTFMKDHSNTIESGILQTTAIGIFPKGKSPFGCLDMAGNVEEYVSDFYARYPGGITVNDDLITVNGDYRVARGGSFIRFRDLARCKRRHGPNPKIIYAMGFRIAEDF